MSTNDVLNNKTRKKLQRKAEERLDKKRSKKSRRTTTPTALPKTVTAVLMRNGGPEYNPANDPDAPLHQRHGDVPEWSYRDRVGPEGIYDPNYHPFAAVQLLAEGGSPIELALEFGVYPATIYKWIKAHEEFALAVDHGRVLTKAWWIREGRKQLNNPRFNNALYALHMANRFGWVKKSETLLSNPGAIMSVDEVLPKELQQELCDDDEIIEAEVIETDDVGRSAEILGILMQAGALNAAPSNAEDDE